PPVTIDSWSGDSLTRLPARPGRPFGEYAHGEEERLTGYVRGSGDGPRINQLAAGAKGFWRAVRLPAVNARHFGMDAHRVRPCPPRLPLGQGRAPNDAGGYPR